MKEKELTDKECRKRFANLYLTLKGDHKGVVKAWQDLGVHLNAKVTEHVTIWYITGYLIGKEML